MSAVHVFFEVYPSDSRPNQSYHNKSVKKRLNINTVTVLTVLHLKMQKTPCFVDNKMVLTLFKLVCFVNS